MALPFLFASVASLVTSQLDSNFAALGVLTPIPCTVAGTNTLTLTPASNTASFTQYQNYMQFSGVVTAQNTGAVTANIGGVGALNIYKDSPAGPIVLSGGELVVNCAFTLLYDSTLNSGSGGFHLFTTTAITGSTISPSVVNAASGLFTTASIPGLALGQMTLATSTVNPGAKITRILSNTFSVASITISANSSTDQSVSLGGVFTGDTIMIGWPSTLNVGVVLTAFCPVSNTLVLRAGNVTASAVTVTGNIFRLTAMGNT